MEVKKETTSATSGGNRILVFTPETGNSIFRKSMEYYMSTALQMEALQIIIYPVKKFLHLRLRLRCYNKSINIFKIILSNGIYL